MTKIYIIPGLGESCTLKRYQDLVTQLEEKKYTVIPVNLNWYKPLIPQIFKIEKDSIICGFSFGAIFAYLLAQKYPCKKIIFASISPIHLFSFDSLKKDYMEQMGEEMAIVLAKEIKSIKIKLETLPTSWITLAGEKEEKLRGEKKTDMLIPDTAHFMTKKYIDAIVKLV